MKKLIVLITLFFTVTAFASNGKDIANKLGISASSKASSQWSRIFKKTKKMKKYGIDVLSDADKSVLKTYLVDHAADSDSPEAAGM